MHDQTSINKKKFIIAKIQEKFILVNEKTKKLKEIKCKSTLMNEIKQYFIKFLIFNFLKYNLKYVQKIKL